MASFSVASLCVEFDALRTIKGSLIDTNGNLSNWDRGDPCTSNWTGVMCLDTTHLLNMNLSGTLAPEIGRLSYLEVLDFMWNDITGSIPKEIGFINPLKLLLLNGNQLTGELPEELGFLPFLIRFQIDQNNITGPIPLSFAKLNTTVHFHMNNNSLSGKIPPQLSSLGSLLHLLLDNNKLTGDLPSELSEMPSLKILAGQGQMIALTRFNIHLSQFVLPSPSSHQILEFIPSIFQLDNNNFGGNSIPHSYANMSKLIKLSLRNCNLQGPIPDLSTIPRLTYLDLSFNQFNESIPTNKLSDNITTIDLSNNDLIGTIPSYFSRLPRLQKLSIANNSLNGSVPSTIWQDRILNGSEMLHLLEGNPMCSNNNTLAQFCGSESDSSINGNFSVSCPTQACPLPMNIQWTVSVLPRCSHVFNTSEVLRLRNLFLDFDLPTNDLFGPFELLDFILLDPYRDVTVTSPSSGISKGALAGIVLGAIAFVISSMNTTDLAYTFGGYGRVFKGVLPDGTVVAIKRAQEGSLQGEKEFLTEIELLSRLHHRNLVSLIGYCDEEGEQIALGSAKGLVYLHTEVDPPIFHRDVKATNILLDSKFTAKVADFGLSRLAPVPDTQGNVPGHVSTVVMGTPGYIDPEYFLTHKLTDKSDVYSLGVVFLELVTGRPPIFHGENIIRHVSMAYESGGLFSVIDKRIGSYPSEYVEKFLTLALKCCKDAPDERPKIAEVARELENICSMLPETNTVEAEHGTSGSGRIFSSQPSSSATRTPFVSEDVSGSDLVSGKMPTIRPR
ncbi:hypothetical protein ACSQ67_017443 [Phaseolus vulgaris]